MSDATQGEADPAPAEHRVTRAEVEREILLEARAEALTLRSELRALRAIVVNLFYASLRGEVITEERMEEIIQWADEHKQNGNVGELKPEGE